MAEEFDPYKKWLGIAPKDQPPNHYRLLGVDLFEADPDTIASAADQRMIHVRSFQAGKYSAFSQRILNEIAAARICLLSPDKKAQYDRQLRHESAASDAEPAEPGVALEFVTRRGSGWRGRSRVTGTRSRSRNTAFPVLGVVTLAAAFVVVILLLLTGQTADESDRPTASQKALKSDPVVTPDRPAGNPKVEKPSVPPGPKRPKRPRRPDGSQGPSTRPPGELPPLETTPDTAEQRPPTPPPPEPKPGVEKRLPVPDEAAQRKSLAAVRDLFQDDYKATAAPEKLALAKKLLQKGQDEDDPTVRFVLFQEARDFAVQTGECGAALQCIDQLGAGYAVDALAMKFQALDKIAKAARTWPQRKAIAQAALELLDAALAAEDFAAAKQIGVFGVAQGRQARDMELVREIVARGKEIEAVAESHAEAQKALATLREKPDDPEANAMAGKYLCRAKGDWQRGLSMLLRCNDATWQQLAERDRKGATSADEQVQIGHGWWELADAEKADAEKRRLQLRAVYWYQQAIPRLTGLAQESVRKRIEQVAPAPSVPRTDGDSRP